MSKISVIVPVFKVEPYIKRCVDSILAQTFKDFELILVDDGSPDNCGKICDEYAQKDERIHVIHQENGGLSAARNAGIDWVFANSESEWLTFVDSDDWIDSLMLECLLIAVKKAQVKVGVCGYVKTSGENPIIQNELLSVQLWFPENFFVENNVNATVAWGKLFHKDCFDIIRYPVGKLHEDEFTTYKILFQYDTISVINAPLYRYFQNPMGIMNSNWTSKRLDGIEARKEQIKFFEEHHFEQAKLRAQKALLWNTKAQLEMVRDLNQKKNVRYMKKLLRKSIRQYKKDLSLSLSKDSGLYEAAYPKCMQIYWLFRSVLGKLRIGR